MSTALIVGAGLIGMSFAQRFVNSGWNVHITDVAAEVEEKVTDTFDDRFGTTVTFSTDMKKAAEGVDFVQESGPEKIEIKRQMFADLAAATDDGVPLASSSSALLPSKIAEGNPAADRILIGHPFTPPSLMPVLEIVPGPGTSQEIVDKALAVYKEIGLDPSQLKKEIPGFVGNRIQKIIMWELIGLVQEGVVDVEEADRIVRNSLGLRYATVGPFEANQLGGGKQGIRGLFENIAYDWDTTLKPLQPDLGHMEDIFTAVEEAFGDDPDARIAKRDHDLQGFLEVRGDKK